MFDLLSHFNVTERSVRAAINSISPSKAYSSDNAGAIIILECREELVSPLNLLYPGCCSPISARGVSNNQAHVFLKRPKRSIELHTSQLSSTAGREICAESSMSYFKGDKTDPLNYIPVSFLPQRQTILCRTAYDQLFRPVSSALCPEQHGFPTHKSCTSNLSVFLISAWKTILEGYQTDAIYPDFSAAFQSVNRSLLVHKLKT